MSNLRNLLVMVLAGVLLGGGAGCELKGGPGHWLAGDGAEVWEPVPAEARLLAPTRWMEADGERVLYVRLELRDAMEDAVKAAGELRFELYEGEDGQGGRLASWGAELLSLADQQARYDRITQTYEFELSVDDAGLASDAHRLRAVFTPARTGQRITTERTVAAAE